MINKNVTIFRILLDHLFRGKGRDFHVVVSIPLFSIVTVNVSNVMASVNIVRGP